MVAVAKKDESARPRTRIHVSKVPNGKGAGASAPADAERQIQELERTFTDRWEW